MKVVHKKVVGKNTHHHHKLVSLCRPLKSRDLDTNVRIHKYAEGLSWSPSLQNLLLSDIHFIDKSKLEISHKY